MQELIARILADPEAAQALAVALVSALTPVAIWIARKCSWKSTGVTMVIRLRIFSGCSAA